MNTMPADGRLTRLLPALKGAPAALFLALALGGGMQTTRSLAQATGYSIKIVRQGLARLQDLGLAANEADMHAWFLAPQAELAALLFSALQTAVSPPHSAALANGRHAQDLHNKSTTLSTGAHFSASPVESSASVAYLSPAPAPQPQETTVLAPHDPAAPAHYPAESSAAAEESAAAAEKIAPMPVKRAASRAPDLLAFAAAVDPPHVQGLEAASKAAGGARASPQANGADNKALASWLRKGGVAYRSAKMKDLLAAELDLELVRAHVLERLAWEAGLVPEMSRFGVGLLIRRLLEGDPPPPMRCPDCLHRRDEHGRCRCHLEAVIRR